MIKCGYCGNTGKHQVWSYPEGAKGPHTESIENCMSGGTMTELEESLEFFLHQMIRCSADGIFDPKDQESVMSVRCKGCEADRDPIRNIIAHMVMKAEEEKCYHVSEDFIVEKVDKKGNLYQDYL